MILQVKMCGSISAISLQVWLTLMLLSRLQGKVLAPPHLQAMAGLPFMLACNITMETGEVLKQVLWLDMANKTILHYQPDKNDHITKVDGVELSQQTAGQQAHTSVITIRRAAPANEGCYQCLFDVYPTGQQRGRTCLSLTGEAWVEAKLCRAAALHDRHSQPLTYSGYGKYSDPLKFFTLCYIAAIFLPKPEASYVTVSEDIVEANCSAVSRPAAEISWNVEGHNQTLGPAVTSFYQLGDGTTMVVSSIQMQAELLDDELVKCEVRHQGLESAIYVSLNKYFFLVNICVALVLLICLCICLKRFLKFDDHRRITVLEVKPSF
uniref:Ig-like domain-containing protein n=1 Tax=Sinocyclocheilus grahami TaxID=75366 RepID=A0A672KTD9_SINGR